MSILKNITTGRRGRAQKVTIYGPEGFGKSTLASLFPQPLFLDVEDSTSQLDVARLGRSDVPDLRAFESALAEIAKERPCKTLVVDTIDWTELMALDAIIADENNAKIKGIEDFGYGKGYTILKERVTLLLAKFDTVIAAGIHVVLLAHSKVIKFEPPDGAGAYDRYELKLSKQVAPLIKEWADMLIFGNWRTQISEKGKGDNVKYKGVGGRERLMHCNRTAAWDAKNRHGMADTEKWEIGVIETAFRAVNAPWDNAAPAIPVSAPVAQPSEGKVEPHLEAGTVTPAKTGSGVAKSDVASAQQKETGVKAPPSDTSEKTTAPATPPQATSAGAEYHDFAKIVEPHAEAVTKYLIQNNRLKAGQPWTDVPMDFVKRVLKNPAGFLKVCNAGGAK